MQVRMTMEPFLEAPTELEALVERIIRDYHRPLQEELLEVDRVARQVLAVQGARRPAYAPTLTRLAGLVSALRAELAPHLAQEEQVLFPLIVRGPDPSVAKLIEVMRRDHARTDALLARLRAETNGYVAPPEACGTWRAMLALLRQMDDDLAEHLRLEEDVLYPAALGA